MRLSYLRVAAAMTAREVVRGRLVLALVVLIPAVFFTVARVTTTAAPVTFQLAALDGRAISIPQRDEVAIFIALAATGLLTSFIGLKLTQRDADVSQRLVLCGYRARELVLARLCVLVAVVVVVAAYVGAALPLAFFRVERPGAVLSSFVAMGWVYGCYGLLVGALIRKELEGILFVALMTNLDSGWLQNPIWYAEAQNQIVIRSLPAYFPAQGAMASAFTDGAIGLPLLGALAYGLVLLAVALAVFTWRSRRR